MDKNFQHFAAIWNGREKRFAITTPNLLSLLHWLFRRKCLWSFVAAATNNKCHVRPTSVDSFFVCLIYVAGLNDNHVLVLRLPFPNAILCLFLCSFCRKLSSRSSIAFPPNFSWVQVGGTGHMPNLCSNFTLINVTGRVEGFLYSICFAAMPMAWNALHNMSL